MKDEQRVYIKGNHKRGAEIIKTLTDLGGKNIYRYNGENDNVYYYIAPNGVIRVVAPTYEASSFVKEFYKEIKLPRWKPKHGDYYYFINYKGMAMRNTWFNSVNEYTMYEFGNCFKTFEEAELARDKIKEILNQ